MTTNALTTDSGPAPGDLERDRRLEVLLDELVTIPRGEELPADFAARVLARRPFAPWEVSRVSYWRLPAGIGLGLLAGSLGLALTPLWSLGPGTALTVWAELVAVAFGPAGRNPRHGTPPACRGDRSCGAGRLPGRPRPPGGGGGRDRRFARDGARALPPTGVLCRPPPGLSRGQRWPGASFSSPASSFSPPPGGRRRSSRRWSRPERSARTTSSSWDAAPWWRASCRGRSLPSADPSAWRDEWRRTSSPSAETSSWTRVLRSGGTSWPSGERFVRPRDRSEPSAAAS